MNTKIGKPQTKQNVHQNLITELLTFCHTLTSNFNSPPDMLLFLSRPLLKRPKVKIKFKEHKVSMIKTWYVTLFN